MIKNIVISSVDIFKESSFYFTSLEDMYTDQRDTHTDMALVVDNDVCIFVLFCFVFCWFFFFGYFQLTSIFILFV